MTNEEKRNAISEYFKPSPRWKIFFATCLILLGLLGLIRLVGFEINDYIVNKYLSNLYRQVPQSQPLEIYDYMDDILLRFFLFTVLIIIGLIIIFAPSGVKKPSDQDVDNYISEDLLHAKIKSLQKASIDESELVGESVVVTGPRFWNTAGATILFKKGADGLLRFTPMNVSVLHMTQHQIIAYQCCLDLMTGNFLNESTDEYFYKDVVSVATKTESKTYQSEKFGKIQLHAAETFVLTTSGGTSIETILKDPKLIKMMGGGEIPTTEAERAIQVVRKMLREKKQA